METDNDQGLISAVKNYFNLRYEVMQLQLAGKISASGSSLIASVIVSVVALIALLFLSVALAFYLSGLLGSYMKGFSVMGVCYLFLVIFLFVFRKKLLSAPIENKMINELLRDKSADGKS